MLFKLEDNVPEVYILLSRDFLLLCKAYNVIINSSISQTDKLRNLLNSSISDDRLLVALSKRCGFTNDNYIPTEVLRNILLTFPSIVKNKGNIIGIELAVRCIAKLYLNVLSNKVNYDTSTGVINVELIVSNLTYDIDLSYLKDVLKYVVPVGCQVKVVITQQSSQLAQLSNKQMLRAVRVSKPRILRQEYLRF